MPNGESLEHKVAELIESLPPMPATVDRLLAAAIARDGAEVQKQLVREDPVLCFELLHVANSSCFDGPERVETISAAIDRVGLEPLAQWVGVKHTAQVLEDRFASLTDLDGYFAHSQEVSNGCRVLAKVTGMDTHRQEMFRVAGLIHDIGRLVILLSANRLNEPLMGTTWDKMATIVGDEQTILGMNHCDIGAALCRKWNFSPTLHEGVLRHHSPLLDGQFSYPGAMIFVAHFVSMSDFTGQTLMNMFPHELLEKLGLDEVRFDEARSFCLPRPGGS